MRVLAHPMIRRDIEGLAEHVSAVSGSAEAARRRILEVRELIGQVVENPFVGAPLDEGLTDWRVRHGGTRRRINVVFRHDAVETRIDLALVAFCGEDWMGRTAARTGYFPGL